MLVVGGFAGAAWAGPMGAVGGRVRNAGSWCSGAVGERSGWEPKGAMGLLGSAREPSPASPKTSASPCVSGPGPVGAGGYEGGCH